MGAPNIVIGGSHSGNVAAHDLATEGLLDGLASDYVPISMIQAIFVLHRKWGVPLSEAVAMASANPAEMVGLTDRGRLEAGRRADLTRVHMVGGVAVVREVWIRGERVM
jgi:alpha-D-ribose 1-methylphosphonate 5-triphosphate diphosphatase